MFSRRACVTQGFSAIAAAAILLLAVAGFAGDALAQANCTFVSAQNGSDSNPCTVALPCRGFQKAESVTNTGGEILALDSGGYGVLSITKSITINAPDGIEAGVTTSSAGDAITINAPGGVVNLRGLTLVGGGVGTNGITFTAGAALDIQNCVVAGFTQNGFNLNPGASTVTVTVTIVSDNNQGIQFSPSAGATASFKRVQVLRNSAVGVDVVTTAANVTATAADSIAARNGTGFSVDGATMLIINSAAISNRGGITVFNGTMIIAGTTISGNTSFGFSAFPIDTFGNNFFTDNGTNFGTLMPIAQQ